MTFERRSTERRVSPSAGEGPSTTMLRSPSLFNRIGDLAKRLVHADHAPFADPVWRQAAQNTAASTIRVAHRPSTVDNENFPRICGLMRWLHGPAPESRVSPSVPSPVTCGRNGGQPV